MPSYSSWVREMFVFFNTGIYDIRLTIFVDNIINCWHHTGSFFQYNIICHWIKIQSNNTILKSTSSCRSLALIWTSDNVDQCIHFIFGAMYRYIQWFLFFFLFKNSIEKREVFLWPQTGVGVFLVFSVELVFLFFFPTTVNAKLE